MRCCETAQGNNRAHQGNAVLHLALLLIALATSYVGRSSTSRSQQPSTLGFGCNVRTTALTSKHHGYSITSSARARRDAGIAMPSALAVFRLINNSNFVGCSTGRSPGLAPLKILST